jgi:hypothetical protein
MARRQQIQERVLSLVNTLSPGNFVPALVPGRR